MDEGFTIRRAATELEYTPHHVRLLIRNGNLKAIGTGHARRVSAESLEQYRCSEKRRIQADISLDAFEDLGKNWAVAKIVKNIPAFSKPSAAAKLLGLRTAEFDNMVRSGLVPSEELGGRQFIPKCWLADKLAKAYGTEFLRPVRDVR